jgi:transposase
MREEKISYATVNKMLLNPTPLSPVRDKRPPTKIGPYLHTIEKMLSGRTDGRPPVPIEASKILAKIREDGYAGSEKLLKHKLGSITRRRYQFWCDLYDVLNAFDRERAVRLLFYLYRADPQTDGRSESLLKACKLLTDVAWLIDPRYVARRLAGDWIRRLVFGKVKINEIKQDLGDIPDLRLILSTIRDGGHYNRMKGIALLAYKKGIKKATICQFTGMNKGFVDKNLKIYKEGGLQAIFALRSGHPKRYEDDEFRRAVFKVLHSPPKDYGVNRASWSMLTLREALIKDGHPACADVIRQVLKSAGYNWRKARHVLTSKDPNYREKVARVREVASLLGVDEALFSIDEFGPFNVRKIGGRSIVGPGKTPIVQQQQKSRGLIIVTAAIELSSNQVTHFYSKAKNSSEMIKLLELLRQEYRQKKKLWMTWDAASWHQSKVLETFIYENNLGNWPKIESLLLPAGGQFLNIIESIFSGMARSSSQQ